MTLARRCRRKPQDIARRPHRGDGRSARRGARGDGRRRRLHQLRLETASCRERPARRDRGRRDVRPPRRRAGRRVQRRVRVGEPDRAAARRPRPPGRARRRDRGAARVDRLEGHARVLLQRRRRADRRTSRCSVQARVVERATGTLEIPEGGYHGEYIREIAAAYVGRAPGRSEGRASSTRCARFAVQALRNEQDLDLQAFGVRFDVYLPRVVAVHRRQGRRDGRGMLSRRGPHVRAGRRLWLRTTDFGDDKDRVMREARRARYTYFVPDVAYHVTKWQRGFRARSTCRAPTTTARSTRVRAGLQALDMGIPDGLPGVRAAPDGDGDARRRGGEDLQARRQLRDGARPGRRGRARRGALLLPHAEGRLAARRSTSTSRARSRRRIRSTTSRWRTRA